eukprot:2046505-Alexandrium_andersonii.AAC.1
MEDMHAAVPLAAPAGFPAAAGALLPPVCPAAPLLTRASPRVGASKGTCRCQSGVGRMGAEGRPVRSG